MNDILLLGDEKNTQNLLTTLFKTEGYEVVDVSSLDQCWEELDRQTFRLLFIDLDQPSDVVADFATDMQERYPEMKIVTSADRKRDDNDLIQARLPDVTLIDKPFKIERLLESVQNLVEMTELEGGESFSEVVDLGMFYQCADLIGKSAAMQSVLQMVERVAATDLPVLVRGEKGTDKELVARAIHLRSRHAAKSFVPVECDVELNGKSPVFDGSAEGAPAPVRKGDGGTLFLNDFEALGAEDQRRILHLVQTARKSGDGNRTRFLVGSTLSEDKLLEHGVDRDLVAAVGGLTLQVPPLRDRVEDIPLIVTQLIEETSGYDAKTSAPVPTPEAMAALRAFGWPGNVAQLASVIHGVVERMEPGTVGITLDMLPEALR